MVLPVTATQDAPPSCDVRALRQDVERRLADLLPEAGGERDLIALAMRESTLAPGKRVRPLLLVLTARDLGYDDPSLLDLACAVEMVHAASLVLDDMPCMDNARLRRGRPTIHLHFGEDVAILTAVALLTRAFHLVSSLSSVPPLLRTQLVGGLANAVGTQGLVKGQYQDLREGTRPRSADEIASTNDLKTSVLFSATIDMAAIIAQADEPVRVTLGSFASELGQAFQLLDDLRDTRDNDTATTGKDICKDEGKSTLIALLGVEAAHRRLGMHLHHADAHLSRAMGDRQDTRAFVRALFDAAMLPAVQRTTALTGAAG
ncbi:polyprenyl synthetase family protein [Pigmentiphaga litoralis]|uniref:polyprenyl synthetase family protein n=1 Tax=Pigmentiphaga litoralis TaxID=516702 RepID=UPI003B43AAFF